MKRTTYLINDKAGFKKNINRVSKKLSKEEKQKILDSIIEFSAYYTLEENDKKDILYYLEDLQGNKIDINSLNGYENMYINECLNCFMENRKISDKYKDFIKILNQPREIKHNDNIRYKLFEEYAKKNNIEDNIREYIKFIDKFSDEFESTYNKNVLMNQDEFNAFIKQKIFSEENISNEEEEVL